MTRNGIVITVLPHPVLFVKNETHICGDDSAFDHQCGYEFFASQKFLACALSAEIWYVRICKGHLQFYGAETRGL